MYGKRIRNVVVVVFGLLLLLNLGVMISAQPASKTQYRVVALQVNLSVHPDVLQAALNKQSAEGWQYVGEAGGTLIFKK